MTKTLTAIDFDRLTAELHAIARQKAIKEEAIETTDDIDARKRFKRLVEAYVEDMDRIIAIFENANKPVVIEFENGDYTVRPDNSGDTVCGPSAHNAMYLMDRVNSYRQREFKYRVKYILSRITK